MTSETVPQETTKFTRNMMIEYEYIRQSGATNMFDVSAVQSLAESLGFDDLAELDQDEYLDLLRNFGALMEEYEIDQSLQGFELLAQRSQ